MNALTKIEEMAQKLIDLVQLSYIKTKDENKLHQLNELLKLFKSEGVAVRYDEDGYNRDDIKF